MPAIMPNEGSIFDALTVAGATEIYSISEYKQRIHVIHTKSMLYS